MSRRLAAAPRSVNAVPYGSDGGREHCYISLKIIEVGGRSEATPREQSVHHRGWEAGRDLSVGANSCSTWPFVQVILDCSRRSNC